MLSRNGRGIVVHRTKEFHNQGPAIKRLSNNRDILCFQEVHGKSPAVKAFFNRVLPGWHVCLFVLAEIRKCLKILLLEEWSLLFVLS